MAENILNIDPSIDLKQCILWQYQNSANLKSLILSKEEWYQTHQSQFWQDWYDNVFNIDTANDFGLSVWGQILKFSRNVTAKDGSQHYLTTEQYRMLLKGQVIRFGMGATAPEINKWLSVVFAGKGASYCLDSYDMTAIPFVFRAQPTEEIKWLLGNIDFFPRPAGVGYQVRIIPTTVFGFNGSGLKPFNQGVFANDYTDVLQPAPPDMYQFSINAPTGATVTINGEEKTWALIEQGTSFSWSVSKDGYISASGSGTMPEEDKSIDISSLVINNTTNVGTVYINNQTATGAFFQTGTEFPFTYSVGFAGYIPLSGQGSNSNNRTISVSRLLISPTPSEATVVLNGQTARGAFFITGNVFDYNYTVSYPGLISTSGRGYVTENAIVTAQAINGSYQIANIQTNTTGGIATAGTYTAPLNGIVNFVMAAEAGRYTSYNGGYGAKATVSNLRVNQGDVFRFVKISGGYGTVSGYDRGLAVGGSGIALYINNSLKLVVGGGGGADTKNVFMVAGGGGYNGGDMVREGGLGPINPKYEGYSIGGGKGNYQGDVLANGDGKYMRDTLGSRILIGYGGSGYNALSSSSSVSFGTNQGAGYVNLTFKLN